MERVPVHSRGRGGPQCPGRLCNPWGSTRPEEPSWTDNNPVIEGIMKQPAGYDSDGPNLDHLPPTVGLIREFVVAKPNLSALWLMIPMTPRNIVCCPALKLHCLLRIVSSKLSCLGTFLPSLASSSK